MARTTAGTDPTSFARSRTARRLALALAATSLLGACVLEEPPGPATVVVTVHPWPAGAPEPASVLDDSRALDLALTGDDPWTRVADLFAVEPLEAIALDEQRLPGTVDTLSERLTLEGFETGAFVSGDLFDETSGIFQGFLHLDESWLREGSGADGGPAGAALAAAQFVRLKIPRPLEDTAFAWVHLDLEGVADPRAVLEASLAELTTALAKDPRSVVALVDLDPTSPVARVAVRAAVDAASAAPTGRFAERLRAVMAASDAALLEDEDR
jgi:hypothetical protein